MSIIAGATSILLDLYSIQAERPDLDLLEKVSYHFASLPWENLTKFLKKHGGHERPVAMLRRSEEVMADHAALGAGGTCFSLTNTLRRILTDLGYHACPVMADMRHGANIHCALLVEMDDRRVLLDPGYLVAEPLPLRRDRPVSVRLPGRMLEYRPTRSGEIELHSVSDRGEKRFRYRLKPRPIPHDEFIHHWLRSFAASGMNGLYLNKMTSEGRLAAHNLNLRIDNGRDKGNLNLRGCYVESVSARFGLASALVRQAYGEWERLRCRRA